MKMVRVKRLKEIRAFFFLNFLEFRKSELSSKNLENWSDLGKKCSVFVYIFCREMMPTKTVLAQIPSMINQMHTSAGTPDTAGDQ